MRVKEKEGGGKGKLKVDFKQNISVISNHTKSF